MTATTTFENSSHMRGIALSSSRPLGVSARAGARSTEQLTRLVLEEQYRPVTAHEASHLIFHLASISRGLPLDLHKVLVRHVWSLGKDLGSKTGYDKVPQVAMMLSEEDNRPGGLHVEHGRRVFHAVRYSANELIVADRSVAVDLPLSPIQPARGRAHHVTRSPFFDSPRHCPAHVRCTTPSLKDAA